MTYEERQSLIAAAIATGPTVGMPCTYNIGSDHYAGTIVAVSPSKSFVMVDLGRALGVERFNRKGHGGYGGKRAGSLTLGVAQTRLDESF